MKKFYEYNLHLNSQFRRQTPALRRFVCCFLFLMAIGFTNNLLAKGNTINADAALKTIVVDIHPEGQAFLDCSNTSVTLKSTVRINGVATEEGITYEWKNPLYGYNYIISTEKELVVTEPGNYSLTVKNTVDCSPITDNCVDIKYFRVDGVNYPTGFAGQDKVLYPNTSTVMLKGNARGDVTPSWVASNGGNIVSGANTLTPTVNAPGTYTLTLTHASGCTMVDSTVVTASEAILSAYIFTEYKRGFDCEIKSIDLRGAAQLIGRSATEGFTYNWSGPNNFTSEAQNVTVTEPGTYTLQVTDNATGETASASWTLDAPRYPEASAGPDKKLTCDNPSVMLEGTMTRGDRVIWLPGDGGNIVSGERTLTPIVDAPGTYTMIVTFHLTACREEYTVKVTHEDELTVNATGGKLDCTSASVQLKGEANQEGVHYSWTGPNGYTSTEQNPTVKVAGDYKLTVTNPETGCTASTGVVVTPVSSEMQVTNHMIDFNSEKRGLITSIETEAGPVALMGRKRNADGSYAPENYATIFDTQDPTGDDTNLYTVDWGNALIINQYQDDYPDATQWGGELILDFSAIGPVTMESMKVVGMDLYEQKSWVYLYDAEGNELHKEYIKPLGQNSKQTVNLGNIRGVMKMKVVLDGLNDMWQLSGSAAIDDIKFHVETTVENPCEVAASNITHAKAYPTSFSDQASIEFIVRETENYTIDLYDTQGMLVKKLDAGMARAGEMTTVEVNGRELKEGMYFARLVSDSGSKTFKLILKR